LAFDQYASMYLSGSEGLYFIHHSLLTNTATTIHATLVKTGGALTDLATNFFPETANIPLPVKLISFKGDLRNSSVNLSWESAMEENISKYILERSYTGSDFRDIASVDAAGRAHVYTYVDAVQGNPPAIYYRLRIIEATGYGYSSIVVVKPGQKMGTVTVNPNPFVDRLQVTVVSQTDGDLNYEILTLDGKQIKMGNGRLARGSNTFFVNDIGGMQSGTYLFRIHSKDDVKTFKVIKQ
jgi:hypothetical protein